MVYGPNFKGQLVLKVELYPPASIATSAVLLKITRWLTHPLAVSTDWGPISWASFYTVRSLLSCNCKVKGGASAKLSGKTCMQTDPRPSDLHLAGPLWWFPRTGGPV